MLVLDFLEHLKTLPWYEGQVKFTLRMVHYYLSLQSASENRALEVKYDFKVARKPIHMSKTKGSPLQGLPLVETDVKLQYLDSKEMQSLT